MPSIIDDFLSAQMEALEAGRTDDFARQKKALENVTAARERIALVGQLFITLSLDLGSELFLAKLRSAFGSNENFRVLHGNISRTEAVARQLTEEASAIRSWVEMLERRLDELAFVVEEAKPPPCVNSTTPYPPTLGVIQCPQSRNQKT